jgi:heterodisulfide reductase subunit A-like polyferredoxin/coenzyme F420-reducing hydrogenase delta subunit
MKIGLFLSRDHGIISETVDVDALVQKYSHLSAAKVYDSFFTRMDQEDIITIVKKEGLDGVVLAGNSPKYYTNAIDGDLIITMLKENGINENKIAFANIKEQVAMPHTGKNKEAVHKAGVLIDVALKKLEMVHEITATTLSPRRSVLVIGATIGGLIAVRELQAKGYKVYLAEKEQDVRLTTEEKTEMAPLLAAINVAKDTELVFNCNITDVSGWCGDYQITLKNNEEKQTIDVGGVIIAVNDSNWIKKLRSKFQLIVDHKGMIVGRYKINNLGQTKDPGIYYITDNKTNEQPSIAITSAGHAVLSLTTILDKNEIKQPLWVSEVNEELCGGCGTCVKTCAFGASKIDPVRKLSIIDSRRCKGCGNCVTSCPTGARDLVTFPEKFIFSAIDIIASGITKGNGASILTILCNGSGYEALDNAGKAARKNSELAYSSNIYPLQVQCGGNIDTQYALKAFIKQFDGVAIVVCRDGFCHNIVGNTDMGRRIGLFREVLRSRRISDQRIRIIKVLPGEGEALSQELNTFAEELLKLK